MQAPPTSLAFARSLRAAFARSPATRTGDLAADLLAGLDPGALEAFRHDWDIFARDDQLPPGSFPGHPEPKGDWRIWLFLGGRGAGKTRAGAEWVRALAEGRAGPRAGSIALVGETYADVREVMVDGPSGLRAIAPRHARPVWQASRRRLVWPNGAVGYAFSSEDPDGLRGPQHHAAWCDELAKWRYARDTWDNLRMGLRLGADPRACVTTTPRPIPLLRALLADPSVAVTRAGTSANAANLAPTFLAAMRDAYGGTRLGRQELDGELVADREDALWTRDTIEAARRRTAPDLARIVVAVDPPAGSSRRADACGLVVAGIDAHGIVHVLADATVQGLRPAGWAARAASVFSAWKADALVVEVNQGGDMAEAVLREADPGLPVVKVHATRGKYLRAEPVAALYEQGRVRHAGAFPALEDEMCDFAPTGLSSGRSPDRLDALVWAVTELALSRKGQGPRVRML